MNRLIAIGAPWLLATMLHAQDVDPFFSGRTQQLLDPSRTGFAPGGRIAFIHQDQWLQMPGSWRSDLLAVDWSIRNTRKQVSSWFGIGLVANRERQGAVGSKLSSLGLAPAVHLRAGQRSYLSAGLEFRWSNGVQGDGSGAWGSQYDGMRYDAALASGETWNLAQQSWATTRAGLSWSLKQEAETQRRRARDILVVGVAADHLARLMLRENGTAPPETPLRLTGYILGELPHEIWDNGFFAAELIGHVQGPFHTGRANIFAGKHLDNLVRQPGGAMLLGFKAGLGYRWRDAFLVNAAVDIGRGTIGLAYGWAMIHPDQLVAGRRTVELILQLRV